MASSAVYLPRLVDAELAGVLAVHPAVLLVGPRACGKTTTAHRQCRSILRLDVPAQASVVRADPDAALRDLPEPVLIDEWQLVPEVLGAVKRSVDADPRPGRFVLTGSAQSDLTTAGWAATGRVVRIAMYPLTGRERRGSVAAPSLIDRILADGLQALHAEPGERDLRDQLSDALAGGWPELLRLPDETARARWLRAYIDHLVTREAPGLQVPRDPVRMRRYLQAVATNTGGVPTHKTLYDAAGITRTTAAGYDDLLDTVMVTDRVPAWAGNLPDRLVHLPKRYLLDPALLVGILRVDLRRVMRDGDLLGRVLDTYVAAALRAECAVAQAGGTLFHLRDANGRREIDLLVELPDAAVIAFEIKATAAPDPRDARHLLWLRERLGERFIAGALVHTGPRTFTLGDRIAAVPIGALWQPGSDG